MGGWTGPLEPHPGGDDVTRLFAMGGAGGAIGSLACSC